MLPQLMISGDIKTVFDLHRTFFLSGLLFYPMEFFMNNNFCPRKLERRKHVATYVSHMMLMDL